MDNYKAVLNRLYKTEEVELKSEKVELDAIDDLKKLSTEAAKISKSLNDKHIKLNKLFFNVRDMAEKFNDLNEKRKSEINKGKSIFKELNSKLQTIQKQAKELGIAPRDIPNFSKSESVNEELRSNTNDIQKYANISI